MSSWRVVSEGETPGLALRFDLAIILAPAEPEEASANLAVARDQFGFIDTGEIADQGNAVTGQRRRVAWPTPQSRLTGLSARNAAPRRGQ